MKNLNKYLLSISITAVLLSGCSLDIDPANNIEASNALNTSADVEALLVGAYSSLSDGDLYGGNILRDAELIADDPDNSEIFWDGTFVAPGEIYAKNMLITNDQAEATWLDAYRTINISNTVLQNLKVVLAGKKDKVEGEAKFIRAVMYFELVKTYAKTWTDGTPSANPGVPLVLEPTVSKVPRSSVAAVYAQIISDLEDAVDLLPESNGFFANTYAAHAILSRVYLMQNNYAKAVEHANEVIENGGYSLEKNYADAFNKQSPGSSSEDIFSIQVTDQDGVNNMFTFFAAEGRGDIYIEQAHFDLYETGDARLDLFYDDERTGKWNNVFGNINIIRLSEMYLTRAEGNLRLGTVVGDTPVNDINVVRERVGLTPLLVVTLPQILAERHLELAFEGHWIHDLKRTQSDVGDLEYNANKLVFPIPLRERNIDPEGLPQNAGY